MSTFEALRRLRQQQLHNPMSLEEIAAIVGRIVASAALDFEAADPPRHQSPTQPLSYLGRTY